MAEKQGFRNDGTDSYVYQELAAGTSVAIGMDDSDSDILKIVTQTTAGANPSGTAQFQIDPGVNGNIVMTPNGTGVVSTANNIQAAGISFDGGTNTLDFYETGSFTPELQFGGASVGITYLNRVGQYVRVGALVTFSITIELTNKGSSTGTATIVTLPFSAGTTVIPLSTRWQQLTYTDIPHSRIGGTTVHIEELPSAGAVVVMNDTNFANNTFIQLAGSYEII